jgi:hypothetical protein
VTPAIASTPRCHAIWRSVHQAPYFANRGCESHLRMRLREEPTYTKIYLIKYQTMVILMLTF